MAKLAVVRVRGSVGARGEVLATLHALGLTRVNHCVLIDEAPSYRGMLERAKDMVTWGEIACDTIEALLRKRGRLEGGKRLTDEYVKANTPFPSIREFARAVDGGEVALEALPGLKKVFRLRPPRKGYRATKRPFKDYGDLGYRGERINELLGRMV